MALLDDERFFVKPTASPLASSSSRPRDDYEEEEDHLIATPSPVKRQHRIFECSWCRRQCKELLADTGCTYECTLSHFFRVDPCAFSAYYVTVLRQEPYAQRGMAPLCLPGVMDNETSAEYWRRVGRSVYRDTDFRRSAFIIRFKSVAASQLDCVDQLQPSKILRD